jgi:hypothetical protein
MPLRNNIEKYFQIPFFKKKKKTGNILGILKISQSGHIQGVNIERT